MKRERGVAWDYAIAEAVAIVALGRRWGEEQGDREEMGRLGAVQGRGLRPYQPPPHLPRRRGEQRGVRGGAQARWR